MRARYLQQRIMPIRGPVDVGDNAHQLEILAAELSNKHRIFVFFIGGAGTRDAGGNFHGVPNAQICVLTNDDNFHS